MPKKYEERNLITFQQSFPDSAACAKHLAEQRWADGFLCPACNNSKAWYLSDRQLFVCKECRTQTSLTAGTIFHGTRVPLIKLGDFLDRLGCGETTEDGRALMKAIRTDGWRSYGSAAKDKELRHYKVVLKDPKAAGKVMPWVHRVISNTKAVIRGTHRGVSNKHLQRYLSEIAYRFNRRYWEPELFDRLVQACLTAETITYKNLTKPV